MDGAALAFLKGISLEALLDNHSYKYPETILPANDFQKWSLFRYLKKAKKLEMEYLPVILDALESMDYLSIAAWRAIQCYIRVGLLSIPQVVGVKEIAYRILGFISQHDAKFTLSDYCTLTDATAGDYALHKLHISYSLILLNEPFNTEYYFFLGEHLHIFVKALAKLNDKELNSRFVRDYIYDLDKSDKLVMGFVKSIFRGQICDRKSLEILSLFLSNDK
jgi:hypothetical protein